MSFDNLALLLFYGGGGALVVGFWICKRIQKQREKSQEAKNAFHYDELQRTYLMGLENYPPLRFDSAPQDEWGEGEEEDDHERNDEEEEEEDDDEVEE
jgi:hypothetical protein